MLTSERLPRLWRWGQGMFFIFPFLPSVGSLGLLVIALGVIIQEKQELLKRPIVWGLLAFSFWLCVTAITAQYPQEAWLGIANFVPFFIVFIGISLLVETPAQLKRLAWLGVASAVAVALLGIAQVSLNWTTPETLQPILGWYVAHSPRLESILLNANTAATYLLVMFTLALGLWVEAYRWRKKQLWEWLGLTAIVFLLAGALFLTGSRNGWIGLLLVITTFVFYLRWYWLIAFGSTVVITILGAAFAPSPLNHWLRWIIPYYIWGRVNGEIYNRDFERLRTTIWQFAWELTQQRPLFGWGLRNFTPIYEQAAGTWLGHPHSLPLMLSAEIGIPGLLFLLILVGSAIARAIVLLTIWSKLTPTPGAQQWQQDKLIFFTFIVAFLALTIFNFADVTLFDLRLNLLGWLLLSAIHGVSHYYRHLILRKKLVS